MPRFAAAILSVALLGAGQEAQPKPTGNLSPREALATFALPEGFRIELVACEPEVMDPVAMAFDEDGRLYVTEMADYPLGPPSGRIKRLEDRDGDGVFESASLFADKVPYPNGVLPWKGGILVTAAPDILFFKDTDGDGKADVREVVWTGFTEGNQQHRANGLQLGLDNWITGANGDSGGTIRRGDGKGAAVPIRGADFRFSMDFSKCEAVAGQSQYANAFDDWGNRFINNNSAHIRLSVLPLKYAARNPQLSVPVVMEDISDHGTAARIYPTSRLEARFNDQHTANHFTSACSVTIYRGDRFPEPYRGNAFTCEPVHNLVHRDVLSPRGASLVARRGEPTSEFLTSTDNWFRPVNLCTGPDGALYVVDMYRAVIEHPQWIPLEVQKRIDLRAGHDKGRIWRLAHGAPGKAGRPQLGKAPAESLVAQLENSNAWWRVTAQRLLLERQEKSAVESIRKLSRGSTSAFGRLHALGLLDGLGSLEPADVTAGLKDGEAGVREFALRLSEPLLADPALRSAVLGMSDDPSPRVRFQLALTLGEVGGEECLDALARILVRDVEDRWTRTAVYTSIKGVAPRLFARLRGEFLRKGGPALEVVRQLADLVGAGRNEEQVVEWLRSLADGAETPPARWRLAALSALGPSLRRWGVSLDGLLKKAGVDGRVSEWGAKLLETATDPARDVPERVNAVDLLALLPTAETGPALFKLIRPQEPQEIQVAVVRALASWPGDPSVSRLMDRWTGYTAAVRRELLKALFDRPDQIAGIVERLEKGEIRVVELEAHHRDRLLKHPSGGIRDRARKLLESKGTSEIEQTIAALWTKVAALKGDTAKGEKVYMTSCASCHRLHGQGYAVGPNLQTVAGREKLTLLTDVLNPNRAVDPAFQIYVVKTPSQEMISGVIASETPTSVTLRRAMAEETTVLRRDILEIKAWPASMMPEGLENNLSAQDFADLLEFLQRGGK